MLNPVNYQFCALAKLPEVFDSEDYISVKWG
jgi:hypothetical protein